MGRRVRVLACVVSGWLATAGAWSAATPADADGGAQRWTASYASGAPAFSTDVALDPTGSTVFVTGATAFGPSGHFATLAYDAGTGARRWAEEFPNRSNPEWGRGRVLTVSPDGTTLFVSGSSQCVSHCDADSFEGFTTVAYDAATGTRRWVARYETDGGAPDEIVVTPDGSRLFVRGTVRGGEGSATLSYDTASGDQVWAVEEASGLVYGRGMVLSHDGSVVYVADSAPDSGGCGMVAGGYRTTAYDASDGTTAWSSTYSATPVGSCGSATDMGLSPDGTTVYVTGYGADGDGYGHGSATVALDASTGAERWDHVDAGISVTNGDVVVALEVDPDGSRVFVAGDRCGTRSCAMSTAATLALDAADGERDWAAEYDAGGRTYTADLAVAPDGSGVFLTGQEQLPCYTDCVFSQTNAPVVAYDADSGLERWVTTYPDNTGEALAVSPDGGSLYLAGTLTGAASTSRVAVADGSPARAAGASCSAQCGYATTRLNTRTGSGLVQEADSTVRLDGWRGFYDGTAVGGAYRAGNVRGQRAVLRTPRVTSIDWLTHVGPDQGRARVVIDGRARGTVDLYAARAAARTFTFDGLARIPHAVTVEVLGSKRAASRGTWVAVDGFRMRAGHGLVQETAPEVRFGSWSGATRRSSSGGTHRVSASRSARASFVFTGRTVRWLTALGPASGMARVVVDGRARTVDLYRPGSRPSVVSFTGLAPGRHRDLRPSARPQEPASRSAAVVVDGFVVRR